MTRQHTAMLAAFALQLLCTGMLLLNWKRKRYLPALAWTLGALLSMALLASA